MSSRRKILMTIALAWLVGLAIALKSPADILSQFPILKGYVTSYVSLFSYGSSLGSSSSFPEVTQLYYSLMAWTIPLFFYPLLSMDEEQSRERARWSTVQGKSIYCQQVFVDSSPSNLVCSDMVCQYERWRGCKANFIWDIKGCAWVIWNFIFMPYRRLAFGKHF